MTHTHIHLKKKTAHTKFEKKNWKNNKKNTLQSPTNSEHPEIQQWLDIES